MDPMSSGTPPQAHIPDFTPIDSGQSRAPKAGFSLLQKVGGALMLLLLIAVPIIGMRVYNEQQTRQSEAMNIQAPCPPGFSCPARLCDPVNCQSQPPLFCRADAGECKPKGSCGNPNVCWECHTSGGAVQNWQNINGGWRQSCSGEPTPTPTPLPPPPTCEKPKSCLSAKEAAFRCGIQSNTNIDPSLICTIPGSNSIGNGICCMAQLITPPATPTPTPTNSPTPTSTPTPTPEITKPGPSDTPTPTLACVLPKIKIQVECLSCGESN